MASLVDVDVMKKLLITDVSPRDGLQNQVVHFSTADKQWLLESLFACGLTRIEATSFVSPIAVPQMADAADLLAVVSSHLKEKLCVLVPNQKGFLRAQAAGAREVCVVLSATETMNQKNIRMSLNEALTTCLAVLVQAKEAGIRTRAYVAVAFACPYEGQTSQDVTLRLARKMAQAGADEVVIADTIRAAHPSQVSKLMVPLMGEIGPERLGIHLHDTRGLGLANAWAALQVGVQRFDSSAAGLGGCPFAPGAAGNLATEDLVWLAHESGYDTGIDLPALLTVVEGLSIRLAKPLGGRSYAWLSQNVKYLKAGAFGIS
jgi:hydroxymethylglutaryl-CoA lyase